MVVVNRGRVPFETTYFDDDNQTVSIVGPGEVYFGAQDGPKDRGDNSNEPGNPMTVRWAIYKR